MAIFHATILSFHIHEILAGKGLSLTCKACKESYFHDTSAPMKAASGPRCSIFDLHYEIVWPLFAMTG